MEKNNKELIYSQSGNKDDFSWHFDGDFNLKLEEALLYVARKNKIQSIYDTVLSILLRKVLNKESWDYTISNHPVEKYYEIRLLKNNFINYLVHYDTMTEDVRKIKNSIETL